MRNNIATVIDALIELLKNGNAADRCYSAKALTLLGAQKAIPTLQALLHNEDLDVCIDAATALGELGDSSAVSILLECLLQDPEGEMKVAATEALAQIADSESLAGLMKYALQRNNDVVTDEFDDWDHFWDIQLKAVIAMGVNGVTDAVPAMAEILEDEDGQDIETEVLNALAGCGEAGATVLIKRMNEGLPREKRRAAKALGQSNATVACTALLSALQQEETEVRVEASIALAKQAPEDHLETLVDLCHDQSAEMRNNALALVNGLAKQGFGGGFKIESLLELLNDDNPEVRATLFKLVKNQLKKTEIILNEEQLATLRQGLESLYTLEAVAACELASVTKDPLACRQLLEIVSNEQAPAELRRQAAIALGKQSSYDQALITTLQTHLEDPLKQVRLASLQALMALHSNGAIRAESATAKEDADQQEKEIAPLPSPLAIVVAALDNTNPLTEEDVEESPLPPAPAQAGTMPETTNDYQENRIDAVQLDDQPAVLDTAGDEGPTLSPEGLPEGYPSEYHEPEGTERRAASSTLEAITMDNVESAVLLNDAEKQPQSLNEMLEELPEEDQVYKNLIHENLETADRLFVTKKEINIKDDVRCLSARVLAKSDDSEVIRALIRILSDKNGKLRREAVDSLGLIAERNPKNRELHNALGSLVTHLHFADHEMRFSIARTLGAMRHKAAIAPLLDCTEDRDSNVRIQAINSLKNIRQSRLCNALRSGHMVLKDLADRQIVDTFLAALDDVEYGMRKAGAEALAAIGYSVAEDQLIAAGTADGGVLARDMGRALRTMNLESSTEKLIKELKSDTETNTAYRRNIIEMLEEIHRPDEGAIEAQVA